MSAAAGTAHSTPVPPQSKPQAITQLIAVALRGERFTTFLEVAARVGAASDGSPIIVAYPQVVPVRLGPGARVS
ncbi:hypothetical protein MSZK_09250 [Mycobacterium sp. shizuoka-1]|nr:hypothetical protein MSZK_09250 [Mycobacterium sp. shizuoka-1]